MPNVGKSKYSVQSIFYEVQFAKCNHSSFKKILTDIYKKSDVEDFLKELTDCLKVCLMHDEKSSNVEKTLDFIADFAVSFCSNLNEDESCPVLEGIFQFIFNNHECQIQLVRLRICQLMNRLLDNMGLDATVLEETYNKIAESMLVRLSDSMSSVRTQAVYALHRLQSPNDPKCEIIEAFMYHMMNDPCHEVRRAVIQKIAVNKMTLASILSRMNDVKDSVRKEAYVIISRFLVRQFTIKQRQLILECGLGDRSEIARDYFISVLVPNWLKYFNHNYYEFLECIHVEKIPDIGLKLLKTIFSKQHDVVLESRVKEMWIINQSIPYDKLNIVTVVYWRALAEHVQPSEDSDKLEHIFEQIMPDLTPFCKYIKDYFFPAVTEHHTSTELESSQSEDQTNRDLALSQDISSSEQSQIATNSQDISSSRQSQITTNSQADQAQNKVNESNNSSQSKTDVEEKKGPHVPDESVLVHLLEMCKVYDLSDEMGRTCLKQLCIDLLLSPSVGQQSVSVLASLLDHAVPSVTTKLTVMAEVITELREPLQANDTSVYVPDLLLLEAEEKKTELTEKIAELEAEMEIAEELDDGRVDEIKVQKANLQEELRIMYTVTPQEPGRNVNNDPETLKKCLTIVVQIMKNGKITKMNPTLYSLMQNFIVPTLNLKIEGEGASLIKNLAMQALGIFCVLDSELAKEHFMMFCFNIANETLKVTALKCVFDLLHVYGLAYFNIQDPEEDFLRDASEDEGQRKPNLINLLMSLLTSESTEMCKAALVGLCRLLKAGRIKSPMLVSKLIMLWYSPQIECNPHIRQPLGVFFRVFACSCPHAPQLLLQAFLPTLKEFFKLEVDDPLMEVEVESIANLFVELTRAAHNSKVAKDKSIHNLMAIEICEEILSDVLEDQNCALLMKILGHLELNFDLTTDITILSALIARIVKKYLKEDRLLHRMAVRFGSMLQVRQENNKTVSTVHNTLPPDISEHASQFILSAKDSQGSGSGSDAETQDAELSQEETLGRSTDQSENIVIPGTPETSDSESDDIFKDGVPNTKTARITEDSAFKLPAAPTSCTPFKLPAKTPIKNRKTPKRNIRTPVKSTTSPELGESSQETVETTEETLKKMPSSSRGKTPAVTPAKRSRTLRTPAKEKEPDTREKTPVKTPAPESERITRSSRKRKS